MLSDAERRELALLEAQQMRLPGEQSVLTLEISHPDLDATAYVAADNEDMQAALETGEVVTFLAVAFQAAPPAQSDSRWPQIDVSIDGASGVIEPLLEQALASDTPVSVTFREYLRSAALNGPGRVIKGLELDRTVAGDLTITGTAGFHGLDVEFGESYDPSVYPGLQ